jgi:hypothetical protein
MSESRDRVVTYAVWAKDGSLLRQSALALLSGSIDNLELPTRLKEHIQSEGELDWANVECISYAALEPLGLGKGYHRYNGWLDHSELEELGEAITTVATATAPAEKELVVTSPQQLIETVEEMLREDRQAGE